MPVNAESHVPPCWAPWSSNRELCLTSRLRSQLEAVRGMTEHFCQGLGLEDMAAQSMSDASPTKWHLAHTTWFFETMVLQWLDPNRLPFHPEFSFLFNSYYNAIGPRHLRPWRGLLTRPTVPQVQAYRRAIDDELHALLDSSDILPPEVAARMELGLHHEQQHQELMLTDIKHLFAANPLWPAYRAEGSGWAPDGSRPYHTGSESILPSPSWISHEPAVFSMGQTGCQFHFDNEGPRHRVFVEPFELADQLVTNGQFLEFLEDGGYREPVWWLDLGWSTVQQEGWQSPLYWIERDGRWHQFTLNGLLPLDLQAPVCHLSYYEAEAFARWSHARLPTEAEWEMAVADQPVAGNFVESGWLRPRATTRQETNCETRADVPRQMYGDVWEWTGSAYLPYPGHALPPGALGEYNAKFMCNQFVLRGGSCVSSQSHLRSTYRNYFPPHARWQFSGLRLARSLPG
jgi:ergothioneine biosynthesis protein EgtB